MKTTRRRFSVYRDFDAVWTCIIVYLLNDKPTILQYLMQNLNLSIVPLRKLIRIDEII